MDSDSYEERIAAMHDKVNAAIRSPGRERKEKFVNALKQPIESVVIYSAYKMEDEDNLPIDNLDDIAFKGTFNVVGDYSEFWDHTNSGHQHKVGPITNPTWLELAVIANDCILASNDRHHIYFEGANKNENTLRLYFGS